MAYVLNSKETRKAPLNCYLDYFTGYLAFLSHQRHGKNLDWHIVKQTLVFFTGENATNKGILEEERRSIATRM